MRLIERVISVISPKMAFKRQAYIEKSKTMSQAVGVIRGGGSYKGASDSSSMSGMSIVSFVLWWNGNVFPIMQTALLNLIPYLLKNLRPLNVFGVVYKRIS